VIVYGLDEFNMTPGEYLELYERKLTPTERKYYDAWINWKRFKIQPWRFLNSKTVTRDLTLMMMQLDTMYHERKEIKQQKDKIAQDQGSFRPFQNNSSSSQRPNNVKSVL
jgi:hypothetical protein